MLGIHIRETRFNVHQFILFITGEAGKRVGCSKPFHDLHLVVARGIYDFERTKKERLQLLKETLQGIQRIPTLLLNNRTETLA